MDNVIAQTHLDTMNKTFSAIQTEFSKGKDKIEVRLLRPGDFDGIADGDFQQVTAVGDNVGIYDLDPIQRPYAIMIQGLIPWELIVEINFWRVTIDELIAREWAGGMFNDPDDVVTFVPDPVFALRSKTVISNFNALAVNAAPGARFFPHTLGFFPISGGVQA